MAVLKRRVSLSLNDLENMLGTSKLPAIAKESEAAFFSHVDRIAESISKKPSIRAVFISGPTASGKTTFSNRLVSSLEKMGKKAFCFSLDDYYRLDKIHFDEAGRPDYESISTLDLPLLTQQMKRLLDGEAVHLSKFSFGHISRSVISKDAVSLTEDTILIVEGLHGLAQEISGLLPHDIRVGIFIMPWGELVADQRLLDSRDIRLLRRLVRDARHRGASVLATLDYWPMVVQSEQNCFSTYLEAADFYVNSMLPYESMITAPLACMEIEKDIVAHRENRIQPSTFIEPYHTSKFFADEEQALQYAGQLMTQIRQIPGADMHIVPNYSILNEFL